MWARQYGSSQYPATKPDAEVTFGRVSLVKAGAAPGACAAWIVSVTSAACN